MSSAEADRRSLGFSSDDISFDLVQFVKGLMLDFLCVVVTFKFLAVI